MVLIGSKAVTWKDVGWLEVRGFWGFIRVVFGEVGKIFWRRVGFL